MTRPLRRFPESRGAWNYDGITISRRSIDLGNRIQVFEYKDLQFTNTSGGLHLMGLDHLRKTEQAKCQLTAKGIVDAI